jgi:hypothetical protein
MCGNNDVGRALQAPVEGASTRRYVTLCDPQFCDPTQWSFHNL